VTTVKTLGDAYERKVFGEYAWVSDKHKKAWEVRPIQCHVIMPSGENKVCASGDEFDALSATYMR
jgi:hypothetical protein